MKKRYRIRVKTETGIITYYQVRKKDHTARFSELVRNAQPGWTAVQAEDSGKERGEYVPWKWCDLTRPTGIDLSK